MFEIIEKLSEENQSLEIWCSVDNGLRLLSERMRKGWQRMNDLFDIHCHILPCVDDGAKSMEMALQLLRMEWQDGVRTVILTPHYRLGMFETSMERIWDAYDELLYRARGIGMDLHLGCEFHANMDMADTLEARERPTMAGSNYVLCEFSESSDLAFIQERGYHLISRGFIPIFAHIERYTKLTEDFDMIAELVDMGCRMQVNAGSILGKDGAATKKFCRKLIKEDLLHFIGSDAHDVKTRIPLIGSCSEYLKKKAGRVYTGKILRDNPSMILTEKYRR